MPDQSAAPLGAILHAFAKTPAALAVGAELPSPGRAVRIGGLPGSSPSVLAAWLATRRLVVLTAPTPADAERWLADLQQLVAGGVRLYPQREALGEEEHHYEIAGERIETVEALLSGDVRILVTTARALAELTAVPRSLADFRLVLTSGESQPLGELIARLEAMGYRRESVVTEVAEFSVRGGIVDLYGFGMAAPARLEWWGDVLASMREFDLTSQRSGAELKSIAVLPIRGRMTSHDRSGPVIRRSLLSLLPGDALIMEDGAGPNREEVSRSWREAEHHLEIARRMGEEPPSRADLMISPDEWEQAVNGFARLTLRDDVNDFQFGFLPPERIDRDLRRLRSLLGHGQSTLILCDNEGQRERLDDLLDEGGRPDRTTLVVGALDGGFIMPELRVLTDHEIFRRARRLRRPRRYRQAAPSAVTGTLAAGDYVVHLDHGIGIYRGIATITVDGGEIEVATIEYEGGDRLNVPLYRLDQIERYRSGDDDGDRPPPRIHRLGGTTWSKVRDRTRDAIRMMAAELLDLYARRRVSGGYSFPPDGRWQRELESSFLYEDTADQRSATEAIKADMERPQPMDRLLVGDVGYGKTEVAVRAAFKAVQGGRQVAVLVPTTVLAEQHLRTFSDRLADFPVKVEALSRFRTAKEQKATMARLASGELDIVIGTHRLLSKDVEFKELGLLVVDEEHRFGVKHKERLKQLRLEVDVLTLTATPIPRTLHLSLAGLRDLSVIETPPRDRSPILTFVEPWDDALLEEAVARELDRGGQVFFIHNRIETIDTIAAKVRSLAPAARVAVGHGQMSSDDLEVVMQRFVAGEVDILVSTMIVESGIDVPNANTMIVQDAHRFGLAQLYQLRGRVGRSHRRAACYLLVPDRIDPVAEERLKVLEHHTELGAGYRIALRDMELRGAGNLLGSEQSGHAQAVGFDLYLRWLEETVTALRQAPGSLESVAPPEVVFDVAARFPDSYVGEDGIKLDLYRRLARASGPGDIAGLEAEIRERFGPVPEEVANLLDMARLRVMGAGLGVQHVLVRGEEARLSFRAGTSPRLSGLTRALDGVQLAAEVRRTVPLSLRLTRLGGEPLIPTLVRALAQVAA